MLYNKDLFLDICRKMNLELNYNPDYDAEIRGVDRLISSYEDAGLDLSFSNSSNEYKFIESSPYPKNCSKFTFSNMSIDLSYSNITLDVA